MQKIATRSPKETARLAGVILRACLMPRFRSRACVICLSGELGAGKTVLAGAVGKALGIREKIQSPTFIFVKKYSVAKKRLPWRSFVHIDAYRIGRAQEAKGIGFEDIFNDPKTIAVVEWPEKIRRLLPSRALWVELRHKGGDHRHILVR